MHYSVHRMCETSHICVAHIRMDQYFHAEFLKKLSVIQFQNTILPEAVHFWERALMVRETKSTIRLNR